MLAAGGGGLCIGVTVFFFVWIEGPCQEPQWPIVILGVIGGLFGSLFDSLLGATVQATYYNADTRKITTKAGKSAKIVSGVPFLSNDAVNYVANTTTALVLPLIACCLFF